MQWCGLSCEGVHLKKISPLSMIWGGRMDNLAGGMTLLAGIPYPFLVYPRRLLVCLFV